MQAEQHDHGDWNLPAELPKPAQRALAAAGYTALNNSPTSARRTSSSCTASARRRLSNFAEPSPHAACPSPKGTESIGTGIPSDAQQPLPPAR
jgi:hypothetical protein